MKTFNITHVIHTRKSKLLFYHCGNIQFRATSIIRNKSIWYLGYEAKWGVPDMALINFREMRFILSAHALIYFLTHIHQTWILFNNHEWKLYHSWFHKYLKVLLSVPNTAHVHTILICRANISKTIAEDLK